MPTKQTVKPVEVLGLSVAIFLALLAILGVMELVGMIARLQSLVVLILIAVVFTTGLAPAVVWLEKRKLPRGAAILVVFLVAIMVLLLALTLIVVPLVQAAISFWGELPHYLSGLQKWLGHIHHRFPKVPDYAGLVSRVQSQLGSMGAYLAGSAGAVFGFFGGIVSLFTVVVITVYSLATFEKMRAGFMSLVPAVYEHKAGGTMSKMADAMGGWLRGMLLLSAIVGMLITIAMLALGVPYAPVIGIVGAIGEVIPMVGPFAAAIPAILITAFGPDLWRLIACLVFFALLALVESNVLAPKIMSKQVGLSPLTTILSLLAGGALLGVVGALLAIPVAAALQVLFTEVIGPAIKHWGNQHSADEPDREG